MDPAFIESARERLKAEKSRLEMQIQDIEDGFGLGDSYSESFSELSTYDNHPADTGSETFERSKDLALRDAARIQLNQVLSAMDRIAEGTYGTCASCGKGIDPDRLGALPHTVLCLECKESDESHRDAFIRPVEEQVLGFPFGRSFKDNDPDYNGYDGEDAWQEVARYGTSETPQDVPGAVRFSDMYVDADERRGIVSKVDGIIDGPNEGIPTDLSLDNNR